MTLSNPQQTISHVDLTTVKAVNNCQALVNDLDWLDGIVQLRVTQLIKNVHARISDLPPPPPLDGDSCNFHATLIQYQAKPRERLTLLLAMLPELAPEILERLDVTNPSTNKTWVQLGIVKQGAMLQASWQTFVFLYGGDELIARMNCHELMHPEHWLNLGHCLERSAASSRFSEVLTIKNNRSRQWLQPANLTSVAEADFAAKVLTTELNKEDLILSTSVLKELEQLRYWLEFGYQLHQDPYLKKHATYGFRVLFYGPPGTGKSATAAVLGKLTNMPVYRVDLSLILSKWIGETEKNLGYVFDRAQQENWILFFDEADSLFANRSNNSGEQDRFAAQVTGYLLQRIEDYSGLVILASNLKENIDPAMSRRFNSSIYFPLPKAHERLKIWQSAWPPTIALSAEISWQTIAEEFEVSAALITQAIQRLGLHWLADKDKKPIKYSGLAETINNLKHQQESI